MDIRDAVLDLVVTVVTIDNVLKPTEKDALNHFLLKNYGLNAQSALDAAMARRSKIKTVEDAQKHMDRAIDIIKRNASKQEQMDILKMLITFGLLDGDADPYEIVLLKLISEKLGFDLESALAEMKKEAES